tara:strand:- start:694 stop:1245 length:552 start_codon:yes stop_codon:yes gene_type:complete
MRHKIIPKVKEVHTIILDFDGVLTNNYVYTNQKGDESVCCNRSDGLGFNLLKNFLKKQDHNLKYFILSTECNPVVKKRADKLNVDCFHGIGSKSDFLIKYLDDNFGEYEISRKGVIYIGNDLNDLKAMLLCGFRVCPNDSHKYIKEIADLILESDGGKGCFREFVELFLSKNGFDKDKLLELI